MIRVLSWLPLLLVLISASKSAAVPPRLANGERQELRSRLEGVFNELRLLSKNAASDRSDLSRLEREFQALNVYGQIPISDELGSLQRQLRRSGKDFAISVLTARWVGRSPEPEKAAPEFVYTDSQASVQRYMHPGDDRVAQKLTLEITVSGPRENFSAWVRSWPDNITRLLEPLRSDRGRLFARAYRFRPLELPELRPRSPRELLPAWARARPESFAAEEPELWAYVTRSEELLGQNRFFREAYEVRRKIFMNEARMRFFLKKLMHKTPK